MRFVFTALILSACVARPLADQASATDTAPPSLVERVYPQGSPCSPSFASEQLHMTQAWIGVFGLETESMPTVVWHCPCASSVVEDCDSETIAGDGSQIDAVWRGDFESTLLAADLEVARDNLLGTLYDGREVAAVRAVWGADR